MTLEQVIENSRCKGCMGYPETPLKVVAQAIRSYLLAECEKLKKRPVGHRDNPYEEYILKADLMKVLEE